MSDHRRPAPPPASVVVLNFDGGALVERSVASVMAQDLHGVELVVVDNGSSDGSLDPLRRRWPDLQIIENGTNLGFARGMDVGIAATSGDLVVPLNCDAFLHPSFLRRARDVMAARPAAGALGPLVVRMAPEESPPWSPGTEAGTTASRFMLDGGPIDLLPHMSVQPDDDLARPKPCFKTNGAAPVLRRSALDDVVATYGTDGPYDPDFVTYGEDIDLAFKLWGCGWQTWYQPTLLAAHVRSYASRARVFDKRGELRTLLLASRHVNAWRHLRSVHLSIAAPAVVASDLVLLARGLLRGDQAVAGDVVAAWRRVWQRRGQLRRFRRRHPPPAAPSGVFRWELPRRGQVNIPDDLLIG